MPNWESRTRTCRFRVDSILDEARELLLVCFLILLHQVAHVLRYIDAQDVLAMDFGIELLAFCIVSRESLSARRQESEFNEVNNITVLCIMNIEIYLKRTVILLFCHEMFDAILERKKNSQRCNSP